MDLRVGEREQLLRVALAVGEVEGPTQVDRHLGESVVDAAQRLIGRGRPRDPVVEDERVAAPGGSYAFVLYYRIPRTAAADEALGRIHNTFAEMTVDLGGTFYLPYRKCYSQELLALAYPQIHEFAAKKQACLLYTSPSPRDS